MPFVDFAGEVLSGYGPGQRANATRLMMSQALRELGQHVTLVTDLTQASIARWVEAQPAARSTARSEALLRCIRVAVLRAYDEELIRVNPFKRKPIKRWLRIKPPGPRVQPESPEDVGRILDSLDSAARTGDWRSGRIQAFGYLLAYCPVRRDDALYALRADFDREHHTLTCWERKTKKPIHLPLASPLFRVLDRWEKRCGRSQFLFPAFRDWFAAPDAPPTKNPWRGATGYKPIDGLRAAAARAGVDPATVSCHGFRRFIATWAGEWGIGPEERRLLLGHTTEDTARRWYVTPQFRRLAAAVELIDYGRGDWPESIKRNRGMS